MGREGVRIIGEIDMLMWTFNLVWTTCAGVSCIILGKTTIIVGLGWFRVVFGVLCSPGFVWVALQLKRSADLERSPEASLQLTHHWLIISRIWMFVTAISVVGIPLATAEFLKQHYVEEFREELRMQMR